MEAYIALAAVIVAVCATVLSAISLRRRTKVDYVSSIEERIEALLKENAQLKADLERVRDRNYHVMQRNYELERRLRGERNDDDDDEGA